MAWDFSVSPTPSKDGYHLSQGSNSVNRFNALYLLFFASCLFHNLNKMGLLEIFGLCIIILAVYGVVICFPCILPCYIIPNISTSLNEVEQCLTSAVTIGAIPAVSIERADLETYGTLHSRKSSSHSLAQPRGRPCADAYREPSFSWVFSADWACFLRRGLTYRLYSLSSKIRDVKMRVEVRWTTLRFYPTNDEGFTVSDGRATPCLAHPSANRH